MAKQKLVDVPNLTLTCKVHVWLGYVLLKVNWGDPAEDAKLNVWAKTPAVMSATLV